MVPDPFSLKHRPVVLWPYESNDGPYANKTDCKFLSVGWAQYDPRSVSVKTLRHTGDRWSRLSEELPIHRAIDATLLIATVVRALTEGGSVQLPAQTFENQDEPSAVTVKAENALDREMFESQLRDPVVLRRLSSLAGVLDSMRRDGLLKTK